MVDSLLDTLLAELQRKEELLLEKIGTLSEQPLRDEIKETIKRINQLLNNN